MRFRKLFVHYAQSRNSKTNGELVVITGADPLNLTGTIHAGERIPSSVTNRIAYQNGAPIACLESGVPRSFNDEPIDARTKATLSIG